MQRPIEYNHTQGFMNFDFPKYEIMTPDKFEKYVKQSFNLEPQPEAEPQPQSQPQTQPQPQPLFPRDLFGQIKPATQLSQFSQPTQPVQLTHFTQPTQPTQPNQPIRPACIGATGPNQPNISFGDAMNNLKKEKAKNEIIESLYSELSSIRSQIELLTKTTDNIYRIINKL